MLDEKECRTSILGFKRRMLKFGHQKRAEHYWQRAVVFVGLLYAICQKCGIKGRNTQGSVSFEHNHVTKERLNNVFGHAGVKENRRYVS